MLQIRLSNKGTTSESGGGAKVPSGETVTVACPDHLVIADLPVAKSLGSASGVTLVKTIGRKSRRQLGERVHFCVQCDFPIAIYGRLVPCGHVFCLDCARSDSICYMCDDRIQKIQTIKMTEGICICAAPHCLKSFLKKTDFEAHVQSVHADIVDSNPQKDGNESEAASTKKPTTSDATVQARTPRPQPPVKPLMQLNPNQPHGFEGHQQNFEYPNVMGPASFGQPLYAGQQVQEVVVQPWNGAPFDPCMMMNQGGFFQGAPPSNITQQGGNGNLSLPPPPPQPFANFCGDPSQHGQGGYGWQQDKHESFGNGQE